MANWDVALDSIFLSPEDGQKEDSRQVTMQDVERGLEEVARHHDVIMEKEDVLKRVGKLDACLVTGSFKHAAQMKSWELFHTEVQQIFFEGMTSSQSRFTAMCIFEKSLRRLWPEQHELAGVIETNCSDIDNDVISYVGGSVLKILSRKANSEEYQRCLDALKCPEDDAAHAQWTACQDRGGLTYIPQTSFELFAKAEQLFKKLNTHEGNELHRDKFIQRGTELLQYDLCQIVGDQALPNIISKLLHDIVQKFHKIRIHHRGKILMEKVNGKRQQSLRRTLKND